MLFKDILPQDLYTEFDIIKVLIRKGNLNLIHNKITYQHYTSNFIKSIYKIYEKLIYDSYYIQETSYMKMWRNTPVMGNFATCDTC